MRFNVNEIKRRKLNESKIEEKVNTTSKSKLVGFFNTYREKLLKLSYKELKKYVEYGEKIDENMIEDVISRHADRLDIRDKIYNMSKKESDKRVGYGVVDDFVSEEIESLTKLLYKKFN